jgi:hypothetical protein
VQQEEQVEEEQEVIFQERVLLVQQILVEEVVDLQVQQQAEPAVQESLS